MLQIKKINRPTEGTHCFNAIYNEYPPVRPNIEHI